MLLKTLKSATWALVPALVMAMSVPASARDGRYNDRRGGDDDAAIAIGAGVIGLALGAAIASSDRDRDHYYDDYNDGRYYNGGGYYPQQGYYYGARPRYYPRPSYGYPRGYRRDWRGSRDGYGGRHNGRNWRY